MADKRKSEVWKHFTIENNDKNKVKCNLCATVLSYTGGSTGTMSNHLKLKHKSLKVEKSKQQTITALTALRSPVLSRDRWLRATQKLTLMCARDLRPISIVEGEGFRAFCSELNPGYQVPCAKTIFNHLYQMYENEKENMTQILKEQSVALTCDHWTSLAMEGFLTLTAHFIDNDFDYHNYVLATREVNERHTGVNTANEILNLVSEFGIKKEKVAGIVTDNASNMVVCGEELGLEHFRCFGHTLQLSINGAFDKDKQIVHARLFAKKLVDIFGSPC